MQRAAILKKKQLLKFIFSYQLSLAKFSVRLVSEIQKSSILTENMLQISSIHDLGVCCHYCYYSHCRTTVVVLTYRPTHNMCLGSRSCLSAVLWKVETPFPRRLQLSPILRIPIPLPFRHSLHGTTAKAEPCKLHCKYSGIHGGKRQKTSSPHKNTSYLKGNKGDSQNIRV